MPAEIPLDAVYRDARGRVARLAKELSDGELDRPVPACPEWVARDLVAHVTGVAADVVAGRSDASSPARTAEQVADRRGRPVADILAEWDEVGPTIDAGLAARQISFKIVVDVLTHEADLRECLGRSPEDGWEPILGLIARLIVRNSPAPLIIRSGDAVYQGGEGSPVTELEVAPYELFRGLTSRRSRAQMRSWNWTGDPTPFIESLPIFGPRDDDQPQV